jgi:hypothetical protein
MFADFVTGGDVRFATLNCSGEQRLLFVFITGLWIRIRNPDPDPWARKMEKKLHFSLTF